MRNLRVWLGIVLLIFCAACGSGYKANAFSPSDTFVKQLTTNADALAKSELERFKGLEAAAKNELRYEVIKNAAVPGAVYFKCFRNYTDVKVEDILRSDSFVNPIVVRLILTYRFNATRPRHTDFGDSVERAQADTEFVEGKDRTAILDYRCDADGKMIDELPGLLPRDSVINANWAKDTPVGQLPVSPVTAPPPPSEAPKPKMPKAPN